MITRSYEIEDLDGNTLKTVQIYFGADTVKECIRKRKRIQKDSKRVLRSINTAMSGGARADGEARTTGGKLAMRFAKQDLKRFMNNAFGPEVYPAFFEMRSPFASVGGKLYAQQILEVLNGITLEIEEELKNGKSGSNAE